MRRSGPFVIREGAGGGNRVSAASLEDEAASDTEIAAAEVAMWALGQTPLFQITPRTAHLDGQLQARGYAIKDPVEIYEAPLSRLPKAQRTTISGWPQLGVMEEIWAEDGIGPPRIAVMERAPRPKTAILARLDARPAGVAFVCRDGPVAMLHALVTSAAYRRQGVGRLIVCAAADWGRTQGADSLALAVTCANGPARALYTSLGMRIVDNYHYRIGISEPV